MKLCLACKRWHDPLLDCKRAARMGKSFDSKPVGVQDQIIVRQDVTLPVTVDQREYRARKRAAKA